MFTATWFRRTFVPLIREARARRIDPHVRDRFLSWMQNHRADRISGLRGEILSFMRQYPELWDSFVDDAIGVTP